MATCLNEEELLLAIIESGGWSQYFLFPPVPKGEEYALKLVGTVEEDLR